MFLRNYTAIGTWTNKAAWLIFFLSFFKSSKISSKLSSATLSGLSSLTLRIWSRELWSKRLRAFNLITFNNENDLPTTWKWYGCNDSSKITFHFKILTIIPVSSLVPWFDDCTTHHKCQVSDWRRIGDYIYNSNFDKSNVFDLAFIGSECIFSNISSLI